MAIGSDSGAEVSSCILEAESLLMPPWLLVLVLDRLRVFETSVGGSAEAVDGSGSLWLSLEGSGVRTPLVGLDTGFSVAGGGLAVDRGCGRSLGVRSGEGRYEAILSVESASPLRPLVSIFVGRNLA